MVESESVTAVQKKFRMMYGASPSHKSILRWVEQFKATGSMKKQASPGRPPTSPRDVETTGQAFVQSSRKSV
jgi:transposase